MRRNTSCKNTLHEQTMDIWTYGQTYGQTNHKIKAIEYGRVMESGAKVKFEELFNFKIKFVRLCIDVKVPYLAASPGKINIRLFVNLIC